MTHTEGAIVGASVGAIIGGALGFIAARNGSTRSIEAWSVLSAAAGALSLAGTVILIQKQHQKGRLQP